MKSKVFLSMEKRLVCPVQRGPIYTVRCNTGRLRTSPSTCWKEFRNELNRRQVDPATCILADYYADGPTEIRGVLVLPNHQIVEFLASEADEEVPIRLWDVLNPSSRDWRFYEKKIQIAVELLEEAERTVS